MVLQPYFNRLLAKIVRTCTRGTPKYKRLYIGLNKCFNNIPKFCMLFIYIYMYILFKVLHETFPEHTFLMNGLIQGVKVR